MTEDAATLVADLVSRLERLVDAARQEGREAALSEVRNLVGGAIPTGSLVKRGPGRPKSSKNAPRSAAAAPLKPRQKRKNSWAGLSAEARLTRVNAIRKGKGLPPKEA